MSTSRSGFHFQFDRVRADAPVCLYLHGFMGSVADWDEIVALVKPNLNVLRVDLPGHGQTRVSEADFPMPTCARLIIDLLDELRIEQCMLVGYSMGGRLAFYLTCHFPNRFDRVIIESSSPGLKTEEERQARRESDARLAERILTEDLVGFLEEWYRLPLFKTIRKDESRFQQMLTRRLQNDPTRLAFSLRHMGTGSQPSLWDAIPSIQVPLKLIVGEHDAKYRQIAVQVEALNSDVEVVEIPGAGHNVHFERVREFVKIIDETPPK